MMASDGESDVLSDVEVILPWEVIETCCSLRKNGTSCFLSVNKQDCTTSQLAIQKLEDNSIKIRITVMILGSCSEEGEEMMTETEITDNLIVHDESESTFFDHIAAAAATIDDHENSTVVPDNGDISTETCVDGTPLLLRRRALKGRPRIPTAIDTSRLNKHLTAIWSSKRKKALKKAISPVKNNRAEIICSGEDYSLAADLQPSTVIIVKTITRDTPEHLASESEMAVSEPVPPQRASHDIAERLKERKRRFASATIDEMPTYRARPEDRIVCELCSDVVSSYLELVSHVRSTHDDCTFVRTYLDEIIPLAAQLPVSLPCKACGRTFSGQAALAAHRHECHASGERESKLSAQRRRVKSELLVSTKTPKSPKLDNGMDNSTDDSQTYQCDTCQKMFDSLSKLNRHGRTHLDPQYECPHCQRPFNARDNLGKHIIRAHGGEKEIQYAKPKLSGSGVEVEKTEDDSKPTNSEENSSKDQVSISAAAATPTSAKTKSVRARREKRRKSATDTTVNAKTERSESKPRSASATPKAAKMPKAAKSKSSPSKAAGPKLASKAASATASPTEQMAGTGEQFKCNRCDAVFNRTTLLVTHMRYCRPPEPKS